MFIVMIYELIANWFDVRRRFDVEVHDEVLSLYSKSSCRRLSSFTEIPVAHEFKVIRFSWSLRLYLVILCICENGLSRLV